MHVVNRIILMNDPTPCTSFRHSTVIAKLVGGPATAINVLSLVANSGRAAEGWCADVLH